jgi:uncharacterized protein (TIGR03067 family)
MNAFALAVLSSGLLAADVPLPEEATAVDCNNPEGTWEVLGYRFDGTDKPACDMNEIQWRFEADKLIVSSRSRPDDVFRFTRDPIGHSVRIISSSGDRIWTIHAIYRVRGDRMELAYAHEDNSPLPTQFTSDKGSGVSLYTFRRVRK